MVRMPTRTRFLLALTLLFVTGTTGCGSESGGEAPAEGLSCSAAVDDDYVCTGAEAPLLCTEAGVWETDSACSCDELGGVICT
jgi:hypothetical protein